MKPESFDDPSYVPKNGAEWEAWVWHSLESNPNQSSKTVAASHPHLSLGSASGFLSKLVKRGQVAAVKYAVNEGDLPVFHYSIACKEFVPTVRKRNVRTRAPMPSFNFDQEDGPIALVHETAKATQSKRAKAASRDYPEQAKDLIDKLPAHLAKAVYNELHALFGPPPPPPYDGSPLKRSRGL